MPSEQQQMESTSVRQDGAHNRIVLQVERLLNGQREVFLRLANEEYKLRITRNNKLILTK